ncbi:MAG TPA: carboxymuconolactone decarboxylase family protein [Wenzhouxiangella sp.]|nr:carboxymuconolactone decarboxylase family protein [Wenzhouxiangella sp.]
MSQQYYPEWSDKFEKRRRDLAPAQLEAFWNFSKAAFAEGALPAVTKQLVAVAVAHATQCPYCINIHTKEALRAGATEEQILEAIWVTAEMRAGAAYAHSTLAIDAINQAKAENKAA